MHTVAGTAMMQNAATTQDLYPTPGETSDDAMTIKMIRANIDASNVIGLAARDGQQPQLKSLSQRLLQYQREEIQLLDQYSQQRSLTGFQSD